MEKTGLYIGDQATQDKTFVDVNSCENTPNFISVGQPGKGTALHLAPSDIKKYAEDNGIDFIDDEQELAELMKDGEDGE